MPDPAEIARVMEQTRMDKMQAYRHVEARDVLRQRVSASIAALYTAPLNTARLDADWRDYVARLDAATQHKEQRNG